MEGTLGRNNAVFPLTPTLSLRERENLRPRIGHSRAPEIVEKRDLSRSTKHPRLLRLATAESIRARRLIRGCRLRQRRPMVLPLPEGEGWGEGEVARAITLRPQQPLGLISSR